MPHRFLSTRSDLEDFATMLGNLALPITVEWRPGRDRSLEQNRLQFLWAREVADQRGDVTADEVRQEWKLHHGVPILREDSLEFRETYDRTLKPLLHEHKLMAMQFINVTSDMSVRQMVRYLDAVERECIQRGFRITAPDADMASYHARYRSNAEKRAA